MFCVFLFFIGFVFLLKESQKLGLIYLYLALLWVFTSFQFATCTLHLKRTMNNFHISGSETTFVVALLSLLH